MKHTPGPWRHTDGGIIDNNPPAGHAGIEIADVYGADEVDDRGPPTSEANANARLIAATPDRYDQVRAFCKHGWAVEKRSLYDEESVEGWAWIEPNGAEHVEVGPWDELPPWPDSARTALALLDD